MRIPVLLFITTDESAVGTYWPIDRHSFYTKDSVGIMGLPDNSIQTYRDLIYYQYARIIAEAADVDSEGFIWSKFWKLKNGEIEMSSITKEDKYQLQEGFGECVYCGKEADTTFDHLVPLNDGGEDTISNQVPACQSCNSSKNDRDVIAWFSERDDPIPRVVLGKYLKLLHETLEGESRLDEQLSDSEEQKWVGLEVTRDVSDRIRKRYR